MSRIAARVAILALVAACHEPLGSSAATPATRLRFVVTNASDSAIGLGFFVVLDDSLVDSVTWTGAVYAQPVGAGSWRDQAGVRCHPGCVIHWRIDLFQQRRSYLVTATAQAASDSVFAFVWPADTLHARAIPYAGDGPYCLHSAACPQGWRWPPD